MGSSSNKSKTAVSFSLKNSDQSKSKSAVGSQAPAPAAKNQKQPGKPASQTHTQPQPATKSSKPQQATKPQPAAKQRPQDKQLQPITNPSKPQPQIKQQSQIKQQPQQKTNSQAQPVQKPQVKPVQQSKSQPKMNAAPKQQPQFKGQSNPKAQLQKPAGQPKQQGQSKPAGQPKQQVTVQQKPQQHTKSSQTVQSVTKQQPPKVKPSLDSGKAVMTPDKDKVNAQAPAVKQQPSIQEAPLQSKQPAGGVSHTSDFSPETLALLFKNAKKASENAYAPYSRFKVGAVLILEDPAGDTGQISAYTGCNVENASYGMTCCAERIAIFKAISDGNKNFKAMILYASAKNPVSPCGACRQVISEFAAPGMKIYSIGQFKDENVSKTPYAVYTVAELLPHVFKASDFIEKK